MSERDLAHRTILITGATAGIGRETATQLARRGAHVLIVGRNAQRGSEAVAAISAESQGGSVTFLQADVGDLHSVRALAQVVRDEHASLDTLVNNVAGLYPTKQLTADGLEATLAVTHLGPFLLTRLLVPLLQAKPAGRVIAVVSGMYISGRLDPTTLQPPSEYRGFDAYMSAKLAQVLSMVELTRRTKASALRVLIANPGGADTGNLAASMQPGMMSASNRAIAAFFAFLIRLPGNLERAARSSVYAATATDLSSGQYLTANTHPARLATVARDEALARHVWATSSRLVGLPEE